MLQDLLFLSVLLLFVSLLVISNYIVWMILTRHPKKKIWTGIMFILIFAPLVIVGITSSLSFIGIDGIGRGIPSLFAGILTALNGMYIIFKRT
ncbi:hypothetical protein [Bacillus cereus]|uniref:hypothetical protein n=1 Tax=Bacillus cereus TaxID=1396 RepID=UPI00397FF270